MLVGAAPDPGGDTGHQIAATQHLDPPRGEPHDLESGVVGAMPELPAAIGLVIVSTVTPALARRFRPATLIAAGLGVSTVGYLVLTQVDSVAGLPLLIVGFYVLYPGIAPAMALIPGLVIGAAPAEKAGAASAVNSTASDLGVALGVALLGSVGTGVYRAGMADAEGSASETLSGALSSAQALPAEVADSLVAAAREAFTNGLNAAAATAALLSATGAVLALALLRRIPPGATAVPEAEAAQDVPTEPTAVTA